MEDEIKNDIANKINSGVYKLTMKENSRSPLWSLYATITEANNGSLVEGYVCCTNCKAICNFLKFRFAALYNHECYKSLGISKHNKDFSENTMQDFADRNITLAEQSFETGGGEITLKEGEKVECKIPTSPVWKSFALSLDDEGQNVEAVINCIECKEIIECSKYGQRYSTHKCITATGRYVIKF